MSNKSKRFSVGGLFSKTTSPTKHNSHVGPKKRENSNLIKSRGGKRLTVYLPDDPANVDSGPIDDRRPSSLKNKSLASTSTMKSTQKEISHTSQPQEQEPKQVVSSLSPPIPVASLDHVNQRQASSESLSSSVYPDFTRNPTTTSSIYPQTPTVGLSAKNTVSTRQPFNPYDETSPLRKQSTRNPTLLRKRKPPPALNVITDANEKRIETKVHSPESIVESPKDTIKSINREIQNYPSPSTDAIGPVDDSHYSPLDIKPTENEPDLNSPLSFIPLNIETVEAPVRVLPSSPITDNNEVADDPQIENENELKNGNGNGNDNIRLVECNDQSTDYLIESDEEKDESIPIIKLHVPTVRETIAKSPEFEISKDFSMHDMSITSAHKHSRTISSVEDITNAIDSFQLSHPMLPEEDDHEELFFTDNDHTNSFQRERDLVLSQQISPQEEKDLEEGGLYLKVGDLPELEEGQTIDDYVLNLEREITDNRIPGQSTSSPMKLVSAVTIVSPLTSTLTNEFPKPSPIGHHFSENSSTSDVFYEAVETKESINDKKLAFDDLVDEDDEDGEDEDEELVSEPLPEIENTLTVLDTPPPYTSTSPSPIKENFDAAAPSLEGRYLDLNDEIESTITQVEPAPTIESFEDFYPDAVSDDDDDDDDDDDGLLEFRAAKSPISSKFQFEDLNDRHMGWENKTQESYDSNSFESIGHSIDDGEDLQNKSHLIVINGTPDSTGTSPEQFDDALPLDPPSLPLLPSQYSLDRELSDKTITTVKDEQPVHEFPIYDRREEPSVSPIQHSTIIAPVAPLLKKPLSGTKRPIPDFPNGGRRSRGLSMSTANPELFTKKEIIGVSSDERPGRGQRSMYIDKLRSNGKSVNTGKLNPSMLPISMRSTDNKIVKKTTSNGTLLFGASNPRTRVLASEMDDNELPDATLIHSGKTKVPVHPDAERIATNQEFRKMAEEEEMKNKIRRRSSVSSVVPQVQRMKLFIVNPDSD